MGAIALFVVIYTVVMLEAERLPPTWLFGVQFLLPLTGFAAIAWAFVPSRKR